jgi:hypothetical protein
MRFAVLALAAAACSAIPGGPNPCANPPKPYYCHSTKPTPGAPYVILKGGPTSNGFVQYSGQVLTHTPNDNCDECHIRQTYFETPQKLNAAMIQTILVEHKTGKIVSVPISYDTADAGNNGGALELYRTDAQSIDKLQGDYDLLITVTGRLPATSK